MASGFNLRKHHRIKMEVNVGVQIHVPGAASYSEGISINLSEGGIAFDFSRSLLEGDLLSISLALPEGGGRIELEAKVIHCLWPEDGRSMYEIRAQFMDAKREFKRLIRAYIERKAPETINAIRVAEIISDRRVDERLATEIEVRYQVVQGLDAEAALKDRTQIPAAMLHQSKYFKNMLVALSENLSTSGIRLRGEEAFPLNAVLALCFELPSVSIEIHALGHVAWAQKEGGDFWAGLEFVTFDKDDAIRMEKHLFNSKRGEQA